MYKKLLTYCYDVIDAISVATVSDTNYVITQINSSHADVRVVNGVFQFTLYGLYTLLCHEYDSAWPSTHSYASFRSMVYASELNKDLSKVGYLVQVHYSTGKVDSSWYELVLLSHESGHNLNDNF